MSAVSDVAEKSLGRLLALGAITQDLSLHGDSVHVSGHPAFVLPREDRAGSWRTTINRSLLPASVSAESRRHLLYAVLQDLVQGNFRLRENTSSVRPLAEMDPRLTPFDDVYRVPQEAGGDRPILFPIHIAVPTVFDTYAREPQRKPQTDKGFRGRFLEFFSSDAAGFFDDHLLRVLRNLFARTDDLTPLDRALVQALGQRLLRAHEKMLRARWGVARLEDALNGRWDWWSEVYPPSPQRSEDYQPLPEFAEQGERLHADIDAIAHTYGPSRIERVAFVERLLAYHFALFMVRLTRVLHGELHWAYGQLWPEALANPWPDDRLVVEFHGRRGGASAERHGEYDRLMSRLNEAYLLLPVLNNIELAIRGVDALKGSAPASIERGRWAEAKVKLSAFDASERRWVRELLTLLSDIGSHHAGFTEEERSLQRLTHEPIELLFDAVQTHYGTPEQRRYPKDHHEVVFRAITGAGPHSFVQRQRHSQVVLGDELIYLLVLAMFERRDLHERSDSTLAPREPHAPRRRRLPLRDLEERLSKDLLVPADEGARDDLRASLARLGLIDRRSDVGDGNFLRHPTGL